MLTSLALHVISWLPCYDSGAQVPVGIDVQCCVIDVSDGALPLLQEYDPVIDPSGDIFPYLSGRPLAIVDVPAFAANVVAWVTEFDGIGRLDFYTAREEREEPWGSAANDCPDAS